MCLCYVGLVQSWGNKVMSSLPISIQKLWIMNIEVLSCDYLYNCIIMCTCMNIRHTQEWGHKSCLTSPVPINS